MICLDNKRYRIEKCNNTTLQFALDRKELYHGRICLVNIGWFNSYEQALRAMTLDSYKKDC